MNKTKKQGQEEAQKEEANDQPQEQMHIKEEHSSQSNKLAQDQQKPDQKKITELTDTLQRLQADFENYKKRQERETKEFIKFANAHLIAKFLPVLDTLDVAIKNAAKDNHNPQYVKGIELLHAQLLSVLQSEGLLSIKCEGKKFDSNLHDVMLKEPSDKEEGTILEEFQKGYLLHSKVLRHSKVKISGK